METAYGNTALSETSKNLLHRLRAKELTLQKFLRECAYWALRDGFDELSPLPLPTAPETEAFAEYENLSPFDKMKLDNQFFQRNPEINLYYGQVSFIKWRNKSILDWLEEIKNYLPLEDEIYIRRIDERRLDFKAFFDDNPIIVEKIRFTFRAKEIKPQKKSYYSAGEIIND